MSIKERVLQAIPSRFELAARYNFNRMLGRLEEEVDIIDSITIRHRRCLDIGANVGLYTYRMSQIFSAVESFEPLPGPAKVISNMKKKNVRVHNLALSN